MKEVELVSGGTHSVTNIYCIGRNYRDHIQELGHDVPTEPLIFLKSTSSLRGPQPAALAFAKEEFHHEAELVLLVDQDYQLGEAPGWQAIRALSLGLDLTRRACQTQLKAAGHPWTLAKSFASSAVVGPFLDLKKIKQRDGLRFTLHVNGKLCQSGDTSIMIFSVPTLINYLSSFLALQAGDLIFTGTPSGVGPLRQGDRFQLGLEGEELAFEGIL